MRLRLAASVLAVASLLGASHLSPAQADPVAAAAAAPAPALRDPRPCPDTPGFVCSTLDVPLDHAGVELGELELNVAAAENSDAPRGVLLVLSGGPGQPGVSVVPRVREYFAPEVLEQYQMVMFDQRGTGGAALDCPDLQQAVGGSDFLTPPGAAVEACATLLGDRRNFFTTPDTVRDIDLLRRALGERRLTIDGVSYGTFVAQHYALRYPHRVSALVLDSVVPRQGFDPFTTDIMRATRRVLRDACADDPGCTTDPAEDLAWVVRHVQLDGQPLNATLLLESLAIMSLSTVNPDFIGIPELLHQAREGDTAPLKQFLEQASSRGTPPDQLSAGLHIATTCADLRFPWGDASAPLSGRQEALDRALHRLSPQELWPYDQATAAQVLPVAGCLVWPPARPSDYASRHILPVRTLFLAGDRDLFTPVSWARAEARHAPRGELVVVPGVGHGVQGSRVDPTGRERAAAFLQLAPACP
jgi:pimeloyl-ACP methyl ester carboxylesterase